MKQPKIDLRTANPLGRVDVAAYKVAEHYGRKIENKTGISGLWDHIQDDVQKAITSNLGHVGDFKLNLLDKIAIGVGLFAITSKLLEDKKEGNKNESQPNNGNRS